MRILETLDISRWGWNKKIKLSTFVYTPFVALLNDLRIINLNIAPDILWPTSIYLLVVVVVLPRTS